MKKFKIGDVGTTASGVAVVVVAVDATKAGVQILSVQTTMRQTILASDFHPYTAPVDDEQRSRIRDGKSGW